MILKATGALDQGTVDEKVAGRIQTENISKIDEQTESFHEVNITQQGFDSQEQVAVDILQGFHAMQEELNTCSYGSSDFYEPVEVPACDTEQLVVPSESDSVRPMEQETLEDCLKMEDDSDAQLRTSSSNGDGDVERTPTLEVGVGSPSTATATVSQYPATHARQIEIVPLRAPMSIPVRQPSLFPSPLPRDELWGQQDANRRVSITRSAATAPPYASGRTGTGFEGRTTTTTTSRPVERVVIEDTYAALVHDSLMQALDTGAMMTTAGDGDGEEGGDGEQEGERQESDSRTDDGGGKDDCDVAGLDGDEDWVESYMTQRSQTLHSIVLKQQPPPPSSSSSQTIFRPSPSPYDDDDGGSGRSGGTYSPVLDPNITFIPDTYAPADFNVAMDEEDGGGGDSATQLRGSPLDWNAHIVPDTFFEAAEPVPVPVPVRAHGETTTSHHMTGG